MSEKTIPVVKGLPRFDGVPGFMFWCPWCRRWHLHGVGEGHRAAHCAKGPFVETGYILKALTKKELRELKRAIEDL
jgi:hypothetical protein